MKNNKGVLLDYDLHITGTNGYNKASGLIGFCVNYTYYNNHGEMVSINAWRSIDFGSSKGKVTPEYKKEQLRTLLDQYVNLPIKLNIGNISTINEKRYSINGISQDNPFIEEIKSILNGNVK